MVLNGPILEDSDKIGEKTLKIIIYIYTYMFFLTLIQTISMIAVPKWVITPQKSAHQKCANFFGRTFCISFLSMA